MSALTKMLFSLLQAVKYERQVKQARYFPDMWQINIQHTNNLLRNWTIFNLSLTPCLRLAEISQFNKHVSALIVIIGA